MEGETSLLTCINPEVEDYAGRRREEEKTPKETSGVLDRDGMTEKEGTRPEDRGETQPKELSREYKATEETRVTEPSATDETKQEKANTACHVLGRGYYSDAPNTERPVEKKK
ncbi:hypothetical protein NDU88_005775 [Pleurodeles waltl]|uniref:Uncharacterized protein n=1 Tax=Pleurodeles waltl TaxID=8319 RepID=A0AAV7L5H0_PLEWA|nr:hypothetical protein NDU88_005775 [Pleurodeles waltl]